MDRPDFMGLYESYLGVYEEVESIEEEEFKMPPRRSVEERRKRAKEIGDRQTIRGIVGEYNKKRSSQRQEDPEKYHAKEEVDLYDLVLEYLLDEGLCESVENAEVMMAHMSEGWVDAIVESYELDEATIRSVTSSSGKKIYKSPEYSSAERENIRKTAHQQMRLKQRHYAQGSDYRDSRRRIEDEERYEKGRRKHPTNIMNAKPGEDVDDHGNTEHGPDAEYHYNLRRTDRAARRRRELGK
jgi:hypothetical protein